MCHQSCLSELIFRTSRWPLKAAWCSAVRPARSDTFTLLSSGMRASAQRTALLAAAMCSGVCQYLSLEFTSAECFSNTWTASCGGESAMPTSGSQVDLGDEGGAKVLPREACTHLTAGRHGPVQRREPFVIFGVDPGTCQSEGKHLEHGRGCAPTNEHPVIKKQVRYRRNSLQRTNLITTSNSTAPHTRRITTSCVTYLETGIWLLNVS